MTDKQDKDAIDEEDTNSDELSDVDNANLSPEEKAALAEDDDSSDTLDEIANMDEGKPGDKADEAADAAADNADADDAAVAAEEAAAAADREKDTGEVTKVAASDDDSGGSFTPRLVSEDVAKINEEIAAIREKKTALIQEFEDGDLKHTEYMASLNELNTNETNLRIKAAQADFTEKQNVSMSEQRWEWEQDRFFEEPAHAVYQDDALMRAALDVAVKGLATNKDNVGKSGRWFLEEGHRMVSKRFRLEAVPKTDEKEDDKDDKGDKNNKQDAKDKDQKNPKSRAGQKPNLKEVPKTIGNLPAAEGNEAGETEFDKIDKLVGIEYEEALARMSPEQAKRYEAR